MQCEKEVLTKTQCSTSHNNADSACLWN